MSEKIPMARPQNAGLPILPSTPRVKDPVCGMVIDPQRAAAKVVHNGETYYFCAQRCAHRFENEPEKFLATRGTTGMETPQDAGHGGHEMHAGHEMNA
jgi:Cu+-exporting ATPase